MTQEESYQQWPILLNVIFIRVSRCFLLLYPVTAAPLLDDTLCRTLSSLPSTLSGGVIVGVCRLAYGSSISDGTRYIKREVVLLTTDRNLRVKALSRDVPVRELPDFMRWAGLTKIAAAEGMK